MNKGRLKYLLQKLMGFHNYLFVFSIYSIKRLEHNRYEKEFVHFLNLIPNQGIVLDIGANIGITTVPLAKKLQHAVIHSYEPMPENIRALNRVIRFFGIKNARIFNIALGERSGVLKMVMPVVDHVKMQGLSHIYRDGYDDDGEIYTVDVKTLDEIYEQYDQKITAIKIDVENFEYEVLKGGSGLLQKHQPIIYCELWDNEVRTLVMDYLKNLGYEVKVYTGKKLENFTNQKVVNFFFLPIAG